MSTPATTTHQPTVPDAAPALGALSVAHEGLALWFAACAAWGDYLSALCRVTGPAAAFDAQAQLFADGLDLCSRATASRLKSAGLTAPLLNDP